MTQDCRRDLIQQDGEYPRQSQMKHVSEYLIVVATLTGLTAEAEEWKKHTITESGRTSTAVAADFDGDVISGYSGAVSLFLAPDWEEVVLHRFANPKGNLIHGEVLDVDANGDMDWAGSQAKGKPFWLENPGDGSGAWAARIIDHDIQGIHCLLKADVDNDGKQDLIINNFLPNGVLADSVAWFKVPKNPIMADHWERCVFADRTARGGSHYFGFGDIDGDG